MVSKIGSSFKVGIWLALKGLDANLFEVRELILNQNLIVLRGSMLVERHDIWETFVTRKLFHLTLLIFAVEKVLDEFEIKDLLTSKVECLRIHCFINKPSDYS